MTSNDTVGDRHGSAVITLTSDTDYVIHRMFDAPAELVFKAFTTPELVERWWAGDEAEWVVCDIDLRPGGRWRWVFRHGSMALGFHGEYRDVSPPDRLVYTEMIEMPGVPAPDPAEYPVVTLTLDEINGVTTMTLLVHHSSPEQRDAVLASGMESGMQDSYDRLEEIIRRPS
jgi:uncharacterized protein YndB with AHSA1/START domain